MRNIIFILLLTSVQISANIINIPDDFSTIQAGINSASPGDTVLVQSGTYVENIDIGSTPITLASHYLITGDTSYISTTAIFGDYGGSVVSIVSDGGNASLVTGFTIHGGSAAYGGGIYCFHANPRIIDNIIKENIISNRGGGIYCDNSSPVIEGNYIRDNDGSGIYCFANSNAQITENRFVGNLGGGVRCRQNSNAAIAQNIISENSTRFEGGGVYCRECNPVIEDNLISHNSSRRYGGGIYCLRSDATIFNNTIINNGADLTGGGIYCDSTNSLISENDISENAGGGIRCVNSSNPLIINNTILENTIRNTGAGIYCASSDPIISSNVISYNRSLYTFDFNCGGGGIYCQYSNSIITNNIITLNAAGDDGYGYGGGIYCFRADPVILNNTICHNSAETHGGGVLCEYSSPTLINNIIWENTANFFDSDQLFVFEGSPDISYCNIQDGWPGEGNIDSEPSFRDPYGEDYHLMAIICGDSLDSPCIDMGKPDIVDTLLDCSWGLGSIRSDLGAYGGGDSTEAGIPSQNHQIPGSFSLMRNYPNPFNAQTTISFSLEHQSLVTISIYEITGRLVEVLASNIYRAGNHSVTWDVGDQPSGIYFARLTTGGSVSTSRMVLLK